MSTVISVVLRKGGGGKTTTSVNLASALQQKGHKTLLIDLDDQANATISVGINPFGLSQSINTLFTNVDVTPHDVIVTTEYGLSVLPATEALAQTAAGMSATQIGVLKPILAALRSDFEYIVIDTPPSHSYLSISALVASDKVLIPLQTHYLAMDGLARVMEDIRRVKNGLRAYSQTYLKPLRSRAKTWFPNKLLILPLRSSVFYPQWFNQTQTSPRPFLIMFADNTPICFFLSRSSIVSSMQSRPLSVNQLSSMPLSRRCTRIF